MNNNNTGVTLSTNVTPGINQTPLISFRCIYDLDVGLINLIKESYLNETVFRKSFFDRPQLSIIKDLYDRKEINPLIEIANKDISINDLNDYYNQFMTEKKKEIIDLSVTTEMLNVVEMFFDSKEISPTIMYYDKYEREEIENNKILKKFPLLYYDNINENNLKNYSQIFVKQLSELDRLSKIQWSITYYISFCNINFNSETEELKYDQNIYNIIQYGINHCISFFDMYNRKYLDKGYKNEYGK